jgi:PhzF family phenazine biosynthesis protein
MTVSRFAFQQVDVFTRERFRGNPLAVVIGADGLSDEQMAVFANWTNLSETTFLLQPISPDADYRVRIFTPERELPFAGHPTLGSCHVWLSTGQPAKNSERIVQECKGGLIPIRRDGERLAFAAPPLLKTGPVEQSVLEQIAVGLGVAPAAFTASQWIDNGPGWVAVMLGSRDEVLAIKPNYPVLDRLKLGVVAPWRRSDDNDAQFEVRAFVSTLANEDPVTGSLNAGLAQWMIGAGLAPQSYIASQGTVLGRAGRVHVVKDGNDIWIGGDVVTCIQGDVAI